MTNIKVSPTSYNYLKISTFVYCLKQKLLVKSKKKVVCFLCFNLGYFVLVEAIRASKNSYRNNYKLKKKIKSIKSNTYFSNLYL